MKRIPNPFLHENCDICGFTSHSKKISIASFDLNDWILRTKKSELILLVNCNVCSFAFHSKKYVKLNLTKQIEY